MEGRRGEGSLLLREGEGMGLEGKGRGGEGEREGKGRREREREIFAGPMSNCFRRPCTVSRGNALLFVFWYCVLALITEICFVFHCIVVLAVR